MYETIAQATLICKIVAVAIVACDPVPGRLPLHGREVEVAVLFVGDRPAVGRPGGPLPDAVEVPGQLDGGGGPVEPDEGVEELAPRKA